MSIDPILPHLHHRRPVEGPQSPEGIKPEARLGGPDFSSYMKQQIERVNTQQLEAQGAMEALAAGETDNIGEVMTAVKKAEVAFTMMMEVRNKLQEAYQDVMRMQV